MNAIYVYVPGGAFTAVEDMPLLSPFTILRVLQQPPDDIQMKIAYLYIG